MYDEEDDFYWSMQERDMDPYADEVSERYAATVADMERFNQSEADALEWAAYEDAVKAGFKGTREEWKAELKALADAEHAADLAARLAKLEAEKNDPDFIPF